MTTSKGLEGVIVAETDISSIVGDQLTYVGYTIDDLAENALFEEVVFLLWHKRLPKQDELTEFSEKLFSAMTISDDIFNHLEMMVKNEATPMDVLRTAVSLLGVYDTQNNYTDETINFERAIYLQGQMAAIITTYSRLRENQELVTPKKTYTYAENFLHMLNGTDITPLESEAFNKALVLHADHELNASTFTSRVCVATLSDLYSGMTSAIGALKGPLHGGANEQVINMLMEIQEVDQAIPYIKEKIANKEKIMGMGHRVYKSGDPRAKHLKDMSKKLTSKVGQEKWYQMSEKIESYIKEHKGLPANVDFYSASVYHSMGIKHDLFTPIFAMSRTSGWVAHMLEQYRNNRLIRPRAEYVGPTDQSYKPIHER
ncbi:citrate synthase [Pelagirhabdus alkalitolerans]|uniref:Citrate synthase n=1 Tax=Pelagirhabdus alkalitolerans TaxID=1612202 RepID=A0A1G6HKA5_9BACI|nr:citrate synthase [Pelagirhabdus alkalitolerans]SDB94631.1 citrate synthase [Pelagirhabdus alkalitolerans]